MFWGVLAILAINVNCEPGHIVLAIKQNSCPNLDIRTSVAMALSCAVEFGVLGLAAAFLSQMQVEDQQRKWVVLAFLLRLP